MPLFHLSATNSIANRFLAELRDVDIQQDRPRFRHNLARLGEIMAYEISKTLDYEPFEVETPLAIADTMLPAPRIVVTSVLRAGLPLHEGLLRYFDQADSGFIGAFRQHDSETSFEIQMDYVSAPDLTDATLVLADPMLATGSSLIRAMEGLLRYGEPEVVHIVAVIASAAGVAAVQARFPQAHLWIGAIDAELDARSYIVPGLGDAGDLAFGEKK
jgi:uracil phosphoribosyltransferase